MRHLLSVTDLDAASATALLDTADRLRQALLGREVRKLPTLRGRTVVTMFYENSTRTRVSFEVAGKWMSADTVNVSASGSSVGKGESLRDTAATLAAIGADCVVVRHPASGAAHRMAHWADRAAKEGVVGPGGPGTATCVVNRCTFDRATLLCRTSPTIVTCRPSRGPNRSRRVAASSNAWVGCSCVPSPALTIDVWVPVDAASRSAHTAIRWAEPDAGCRTITQSAPIADSVSEVSRRDSPFATDEPDALTLTVSALIHLPATSNDTRVRVEFS